MPPGDIIHHVPADVAELADAYGSGPYECKFMGVQVPSSAPNQYNPNQLFLVGDGFGLFLFFEKEEKPVRIKGRPGRPRKIKHERSMLSGIS